MQLTILILSLIWFILELLARIWNQLTAVHTQTPPHTHTPVIVYHICTCACYIYICPHICMFVWCDCRRDSIRRKSGSCSSARAHCNRFYQRVPPTQVCLLSCCVHCVRCFVSVSISFRLVCLLIAYTFNNSIACSVYLSVSLLFLSDHALNIIIVKQQHIVNIDIRMYLYMYMYM